MSDVHLSEDEIPGAKLAKEIEKLAKSEAISEMVKVSRMSKFKSTQFKRAETQVSRRSRECSFKVF